ncbi:MAG TPA: hypothetical protein VH143_31455 [Kofleriaceae bacterium]|nr:hypothetical protein [Kofleriaceae bacterium]
MRLRVRAELPTGEPQRPRGVVIAIAGLIALALLATLRIACLEHAVGDYEASEIVHSLDAIYIETLAIALILWRRGGSAVERSAVIGLFAMALWPVLPVFLIQLDFVESTLVTWQMLLGGWLVAFAIGAAIAQRRWPERRIEVMAPEPRPIGWKLVAAGVVVLACWAGYDSFQAQHPWHQIYATVATLVIETLAVIATLAARFRFRLIARAELLVPVMFASAIGIVGTRESILESVATWNGLVALWLAAVIVAIKAARIWRELLARHRRGF